MSKDFKIGDWAMATVDGEPAGIPFQVRALDLERGWLEFATKVDAPIIREAAAAARVSFREHFPEDYAKLFPPKDGE